MRLRIHRFLLSLLMLVLPLQGLATALGPTCVSAQRDALPTVAEAHHCHEEDAPQGPAKPATHDCKHCAACVLGAALPIPVVETTPVISNALRLAVAPAATFNAHVPDGPERPPRTSNR